MATLPSRSQLRKNLKALKERLESRPMDLDARMRMARTHRLLGERRQAIAHYRSVARYLSLAGQPLQAIAVLKELLLVDPKHEETLLFLAKLYARTGAGERGHRSRVAVPIIDDDGPLALPEGLPPTATGIWRSIRPQATDVYTVVHEADAVGAEEEEVSIAAELRELDETYELDAEDVLEERPLRPNDGPPGARLAHPEPAPEREEDSLEPLYEDDADELGYEMLGPVGTEDLVLPQVPLFSSLSPAAFIELGHAMVFQRARPGDHVFREGEPGDSCIVISRGRAVALRKNHHGREVEMMRLGEGDFAGVFALVAGGQRQASLRAETPLEYFEIDRLAVRELADRHDGVGQALRAFFKERLLLNLLASLPVFSQLDARERQRVAGAFVDRRYDQDDELFYAGFEHDGLWVLLEGEAAVVAEGQGKLRALGPGDYIGSLAGATDTPTACAAVAETPVDVVLLSHKAIGKLLKAHPDLARVREAFTDFGMMLDDVVFAGSGRLPGELHA